jgi:hypothetical protein
MSAAVLAPTGYSGTPLAKKLGFRDGQAAVFVNLPDDLAALSRAAGFIAADRVADASDAALAKKPDGSVDIIHGFFTEAASLAAAVPVFRRLLRPDGAIWVSWPKKASKRPTDITEDRIRDIVLPTGLVDVKVAAIDEIWSGLKLVIRREFR